MISKSKENITVNYEQEAETFIDEIIEYLIKNKEEIHDFYRIKPNNNIKINIIPTKQEFDKTFKRLFKYECQEWVVGFTICYEENYQIYLLSYNDYKNTVHNSETLADYKKTLVHEYAHVINVLFSNFKYPITPIWEGVATYLSKQYTEPHDVLSSKEELLSGNCNFIDYYSLFLKIMENYNHEEVLKILNTTLNGEKTIEETLKVQKSTI